uniref:C2H2-type domain-containing protein n=1 Tax=Lygus hesperus TaxID=30085 RepID=A0A0K8T9X5_LYGHE
MRIKMPAVRIAQADVEMQQQHSDVLTCGACQKPFALGDIVKFIQHKVLACNKENYSCDPTGPLLESGDSDDGGVGVVNSRRPSISAPMKKASLASSGREGRVLCTSPEDEGDRDPRCSTPKRSGRPPLPLNLEVATDEEESKRTDSSPPHSSPDEGPSKRLRTEVSDAQSNTTNSEPSNYVCSTCKARLHSAWRLVQHVQNNHGMKIYVDTNTTSASSSSVASSPGTSSSAGKNLSGSSTCSTSSSGCSSSGNPAGPATPLSLGAPPRLGIPTSSPMVEPPIPLHNPFTVGGILRLPWNPPGTTSFRPAPWETAQDQYSPGPLVITNIISGWTN